MPKFVPNKTRYDYIETKPPLNEKRLKMMTFRKRIMPQPPTVCSPLVELGLKVDPEDKKYQLYTANSKKSPWSLAGLKEKLPELTENQMKILTTAKKGLVFGGKAAVLAGAVWLTCSIGIWGDAKSTENAYVNFKNKVTGTDVQQCNNATQQSFFMKLFGSEKTEKTVNKKN